MSSAGTRLGLVHLSGTQIGEQIARSLALVSVLAEGSSSKSTLIDVGSGAGLPAVPLAVALQDRSKARPEPASLIMVEPKRKAVAFLESVIRRLGIEAEVIQATAQEASRGPLRESADYVIAKALAKPAGALQLCAPLCKIGGNIILTAHSSVQSLPTLDLSALGVGEPRALALTGPGGVEQGVFVFPKLSRDTLPFSSLRQDEVPATDEKTSPSPGKKSRIE